MIILNDGNVQFLCNFFFHQYILVKDYYDIDYYDYDYYMAYYDDGTFCSGDCSWNSNLKECQMTGN